MDNRFYVYGFFDPRTPDEPFYIGKGLGGRMYTHFCPSNLAKDTLFYAKLRGMLAKNIRPLIEVLHNHLEEDEAFRLERELVTRYGRRDLGTGCLFNLTDGGEGQSGRTVEVTEAMRQHARDRFSGLEKTIDHRLRLSQVNRGRKPTEEVRARTQETIVKRYGIPVSSFDLKTGKIIKTYQALRHVEKDGFNPTAVRRVLQGRISHCKYIGWRYA